MTACHHSQPCREKSLIRNFHVGEKKESSHSVTYARLLDTVRNEKAILDK